MEQYAMSEMSQDNYEDLIVYGPGPNDSDPPEDNSEDN